MNHTNYEKCQRGGTDSLYLPYNIGGSSPWAGEELEKDMELVALHGQENGSSPWAGENLRKTWNLF